MNSRMFFAGSDVLTATPMVSPITWLTALKSRSVSNGRRLRNTACEVKLGPIIKTEYPSAGWRKTYSVPMTVPPPGRFSTTTFCPNAVCMRCARMRAVTSNEPPAGNGTTMRTGFAGNACA